MNTPSVNYHEIDPSDLDYVTIASEDELANGERLYVEIDEFRIVLFNIAGQLYAIGDVCSHDDGPISEGDLEDHQVACPRHGARFDVRNGAVITPPASVDIPAYPVRLHRGQIQIGLPNGS